MFLQWHGANAPGPALLPPPWPVHWGFPATPAPLGGRWADLTFTERFKLGGEPDWSAA